jgi:hypothetical protein
LFKGNRRGFLVAGPACCASGYVNERAFGTTPRITSDYSG